VAVDRVLKRYEKARVMNDDQGGGFDTRYELSMKEKMEEWKRIYYKVYLVRLTVLVHGMYANGASAMKGKLEISPRIWELLHSATWRGCSG
jgi:hypothetical protein